MVIISDDGITRFAVAVLYPRCDQYGIAAPYLGTVGSWWGISGGLRKTTRDELSCDGKAQPLPCR
jgi:hypothetical protein